MQNLKTIAERNSEFAQMSLMQQRVAIAQDVINQLNARKFKATTGVYVRANQWAQEESCQVCALGALAVSVADGAMFDKYGGYTDSGSNQSDCHLQLSSFWDEKELDEIEAAFERWVLRDQKTGAELHNFTYTYLGSSSPWHNSEERMKCIMQNIVDNSGVFHPEQIPWRE